MNYTRRLLHKTTRGTSAVCTEPATGTRGNHAMEIAGRFDNPRPVLKALSLSLLLAFGPVVHGEPTSGVVTAGSATINANGAGNLVINQTSQNASINWQTFNIGAAESVKFAQPNSSSVALNRVLGSDPSRILGSLSANGKVFLVNPNGILFGKNATVNVGGLVASALDIGDTDFMAGRYRFDGSGRGEVALKITSIMRKMVSV